MVMQRLSFLAAAVCLSAGDCDGWGCVSHGVRLPFPEPYGHCAGYGTHEFGYHCDTLSNVTYVCNGLQAGDGCVIVEIPSLLGAQYYYFPNATKSDDPFCPAAEMPVRMGDVDLRRHASEMCPKLGAWTSARAGSLTIQKGGMPNDCAVQTGGLPMTGQLCTAVDYVVCAGQSWKLSRYDTCDDEHYPRRVSDAELAACIDDFCPVVFYNATTTRTGEPGIPRKLVTRNLTEYRAGTKTVAKLSNGTCAAVDAVAGLRGVFCAQPLP